MKKLLMLFVALVACTSTFAQDDFRDYITTKQKVITVSDKYYWDPLTDRLNYPQGPDKMKECIKSFFCDRVKKLVKAGRNNAGELLFVINEYPVNEETFWYVSGYRPRIPGTGVDHAGQLTENHKDEFVAKLNEWIEPFDFEVARAKNSEIARARFRTPFTYRDDGLYIVIHPTTDAHPKNYVNFKKAVDDSFQHAVKYIDTRGNLSYHPFAKEQREFKERQRHQNNNGNRGNENGNNRGSSLNDDVLRRLNP